MKITQPNLFDIKDDFNCELSAVWKDIRKRNQGFYKVFDDENIIKEIEEYADLQKNKYKDIVVLGIGGSALGMKAIRDSIRCSKNNLKLHILENIDPEALFDIENKIDLEKTLFIAISKSGGTAETMSQYIYFREKVLRQQLEIKNHFVFITGEKGFLRKESKMFEVKFFLIPETVGGRFSVLTAVGLLPSALIGVDIRSLMNGAKKMCEQFLLEDASKNEIWKVAEKLFLLSENGINSLVCMPYSSQLKSFSEWTVQLIAESLGKINNEGERVGITPISAIGATDQHSQLQLFMEGTKDKCVLFIKVNSFINDKIIPVQETDNEFSFLKEVSFGKLLNTELQGTFNALVSNKRSVMLLEIQKLDEFYLGELFFFFEGIVAFLGELMEVNPYDQPGVEKSKILTKESLILSKL